MPTLRAFIRSRHAGVPPARRRWASRLRVAPRRSDQRPKRASVQGDSERAGRREAATWSIPIDWAVGRGPVAPKRRVHPCRNTTHASKRGAPWAGGCGRWCSVFLFLTAADRRGFDQRAACRSATSSTSNLRNRRRCWALGEAGLYARPDGSGRPGQRISPQGSGERCSSTFQPRFPAVCGGAGAFFARGVPVHNEERAFEAGAWPALRLLRLLRASRHRSTEPTERLTAIHLSIHPFHAAHCRIGVSSCFPACPPAEAIERRRHP